MLRSPAKRLNWPHSAVAESGCCAIAVSAVLHLAVVCLIVQLRPVPIRDTAVAPGWVVMGASVEPPGPAPIAQTTLRSMVPRSTVTMPPPASVAQPRTPWTGPLALRAGRITGAPSGQAQAEGARRLAMAQPPLPSAAPAPPDTSAPIPPRADGASLAALQQRIGRAVEDAKYYPPLARQTHREGRVAVSFSYRDGAVADVALLQSSLSATLDHAALTAVRVAHYPSAPSGLAGHQLRLTVWVAFSMVAFD